MGGMEGLRAVSYTHLYTLSRGVKTAQSDFGPIRVKEGQGYGVQKSKPEYEDLKRAALKNGVTLDEVSRTVR